MISGAAAVDVNYWAKSRRQAIEFQSKIRQLRYGSALMWINRWHSSGAIPTSPMPPSDTTMPESKEPVAPQSVAGQEAPRSGPIYPDHSSSWDGRRRSKTPTDKAMSGTTLDWVISLPAHLRPKQICNRFPRIANSLAAVWKDRAACLSMLSGLLADGRTRRRGFPIVLRQEIQSLMNTGTNNPELLESD